MNQMTKVLKIGISALLVLTAPLLAWSHGEESRVGIELESKSKIQAGPSTIEFQLVDNVAKKVITDSDLTISHEKILHFMTYDTSLNEFQHVHPEFNGKTWKVDVNLPRNGQYFIWAQGEITDGSVEFSSAEKIEVFGGQPAWPLPTKLADVRRGQSGESIATLSGQKLKAGKFAALDLEFLKADGKPAQITPYLGAFAHVIATPDDGDQLIHVHPMNGSKSNQGMLHVSFPTAGFYRLWVQFLDAGELKTVPLSVQVF